MRNQADRPATGRGLPGVRLRSTTRQVQPESPLVTGVGLRSTSGLPATARQLFGPVTVLKYAVNDLDTWIDQFLELGIGPWWISENQSPDLFVYRGKRSGARFTWALTWSGDVLLELIQCANAEPSPYSDYLATGNEGLFHEAFYPSDYDAAVAFLRERGGKELVVGESGGARFSYYEGIGTPPQPIELQERPDELVAKQAALQAIAGRWNGHDPRRGPPREWW